MAEEKAIHDVGVTREVVLLEDATTLSGDHTIPEGAVVQIDRQFNDSTLVYWNKGWYKIPGSTRVKQYVEPMEILIPIS